MARRRVGRKARSGQVRGRLRASAQASADRTTPLADAETEGLSISHWFEPGADGDPYTARIRFAGQRVGVRGKKDPGDSFVKEETVDQVVPGSGPISVTTWAYGLNAGDWTVIADRVDRGSGRGAQVSIGRSDPPGSHTLPRAQWSWTRWRLSTAPFDSVRTRWEPMVRLARMPAVIPGSWFGLVTTGVIVGAFLQVTLLSRAGIQAGPALLVDLLSLVSGLVVAKAWYLATGKGWSWWSIGEGFTVDGLLLAAPAVAIATLLAFGLPIGTFLDASTPGLFFGVAIGRLGCFFTGCCAGRCTASRWGVWSSDRRVGARRIPTQLLESVTGLVIGVAATLLVLARPISVPGATFVGAVAVYVFLRQFLLRLRAEPHSRVRARLTAAAAGLVLAVDAALAFLRVV